MLGLGSSTHFVTVLVFLAAAGSLYFTDILKVVRLNRFVSNGLILAIVAWSAGGFVQYRTEDIAVGIARLLQLIQIVILFQEKNSRNRWHILMISLLQVIVATAFQQSLTFGLFLVLYVFANLCALTLIFLHDENAYFKRHSFVRGAFHFRTSELRQKQNWFRILKIAFATFIVGPLSLILFYRENENEDQLHRYRNPAHKPQDAKNPHKNATSQESEVRWEPATTEITGMADLWENLASDETADSGIEAFPALIAEQNTSASSRWPLLHTSAIFSGGTNRKTGVIGGQWELFRRLFRATLVSLVFGLVVFLLIPRFSNLEIFGQRVGMERWNSGQTPQISSVGFTEEIRLGSLGNVLQNHQEVLSVSFTSPTIEQVQKVKGAGTSWEYPPSDPAERQYQEIDGKIFYLRGVVVDRYEPGRGRWSRSNVYTNPASISSVGSYFGGMSELNSSIPVERNRRFLPQGDVASMYFQENGDLVRLRITTQPLDTNVLFTVWPFYVIANEMPRIAIQPDRVEIPEGRRSRRARPYIQSYYTTAFRNGEQAELMPCSLQVNLPEMLQISRDKMPQLVALAKRWDDQARLPKSDLYGRAKNLEDRLKNDGRFQYQLGGIIRDLSTDPLEDFVANTPRGHCEFFAGTLAMMLRSVEIPSRVCIGYKAVAETKGTDGFMVRQSDAHSWVEAYIPGTSLPGSLATGQFAEHWRGGGWLRLDATPEIETDMMRGFSIRFSDIFHGIQAFWRDYIMNMDGLKQSDLVYEPARQLFESAKEAAQTHHWWEIGTSIVDRYKTLFLQIQSGTLRQTDLFLIVLPFLLLFGIFYGLFRLGAFRLFRRLFSRVDEKDRRRQASIEFYARLERLFAKLSMQRHVYETPREFVHRAVQSLLERLWSSPSNMADPISMELLGRSASNVVELFYRIRFGNESIGTRELNLVEKDLAFIKVATERVSK